MELVVNLRILLALWLLTMSGFSLAQVCPYGAYPGRLDEPQICRPPPEDTGNDATRPSVPSTRWEARWGAIAIDNKLGKVGAVKDMRSKREAKRAASAECRTRGGGEGCKYVSLTYHDQCAVMAWGNGRAVTQGAETVEIASDLALRECNKLTTDCKIYYTGCSLPARVQ